MTPPPEALILDIPAVPPSPNRVLGKHWTVKAGTKNEWVLWIRSSYIPQVRKVCIRKRVVITLHHAREYDRDNAYASVKPVVDALKYWQLIHDDTSEWMDLVVAQAKCPHKVRHTVIDIRACHKAVDRRKVGG